MMVKWVLKMKLCRHLTHKAIIYRCDSCRPKTDCSCWDRQYLKKCYQIYISILDWLLYTRYKIPRVFHLYCMFFTYFYNVKQIISAPQTGSLACATGHAMVQNLMDEPYRIQTMMMQRAQYQCSKKHLLSYFVCCLQYTNLLRVYQSLQINTILPLTEPLASNS